MKIMKHENEEKWKCNEQLWKLWKMKMKKNEKCNEQLWKLWKMKMKIIKIMKSEIMKNEK